MPTGAGGGASSREVIGAVEPGPPSGVPDLPDAVVAWRIWRLVDVGETCRLVSAFKWAVWHPGEALVASCLTKPTALQRLRGKARHHAPDSGCLCGIYGAELSLLESGLSAWRDREVGRVVGEVSLWGTVIECEHGFRASLAYPRRIYVPSDGAHWEWEKVVDDLSAYRVPIEPLPVGCADATGELLRRVAA